MTGLNDLAHRRDRIGVRALLASPHARAPLLVSLVGVALLLIDGGLRASTAVSGVVLLACGLYAGWTWTVRVDQLNAVAQHDASREIARVTDVCAQSAPLWIRQIETVRSEADREVAELARVFGNINQRLDKVMGPSTHVHAGAASQGNLVSTLAANGADLDRLVGALRALQSGKDRIVADIGSQTARLKENAAEIRQIALHIRMVTLNATIEAARAGSAGKAFAVVVSGMRELALRTADASEQFSRHTDRLHGTVNAAFQEDAAGADAAISIPRAQELVCQVVESFEAAANDLTRSIEAMGRERRELRQDISQVLVSLQFQDRVSQILSHVTHNVQEMQRQIESGRLQSMDGREWMERMATPYSTPEEFGNLAGARSVTRVDSEVTYF